MIDAKRKRSSTEVPVDSVVDTPGVDTAAGSADRDLLGRCLAEVPPRQRACLVLRHYDDLSVSEVAAVLGCTEGTVKSQTARGLDTPQAAFARETNDDLLVSGRE